MNSLRSLDPVADHELHAEAQERESLATQYHLWIWETFELVVFDLTYQVEVDCEILRTGDHGDIEFSDEHFKIKSLYVGLPQFGAALKLDEDNLREDHAILWQMLENELNLAILRFAARSEKWSAL